MRALIIGDNHFYEHSRFAECIRVHKAFAGEVAKEKPDVVLYTGDMCEAASTPNERMAVRDHLSEVTEVAPVVIVRGNHDAHRDLAIWASLATYHPIIVEEAAGLHEVAGLRIGAVAWPDRASIAAMVGRPLPPDTLDDVFRDLMRNVLLGLSLKEPHILMGHFLCDGAKVHVGQPPRFGMQLNMSLSDLGLAAARFTAMGHIHVPQEWLWNDSPIVYTGSPYSQDFGEPEAKSVVLVDVNDHGCDWTRIPMPATRMLLLEDEWGYDEERRAQGWLAGLHGLGHASDGGPNEVGADIRFRYHFASDQRDAAKAAALQIRDQLLAVGAASVKLDPQARATTRARVPEISAAKDLKSKFFAWTTSKGMTIDNDRRARLSAKIDELEEESA